MKFTRVSGDAIQGTSLMGYVTNTYERLVAVFGEPDGPSGDGKVQVEWDLRFADGTVVTIYDWKQYDVDVKDVIKWNVGGRTTQAVTLVEAELWEYR
jgi:hypothetical protein